MNSFEQLSSRQDPENQLREPINNQPVPAPRTKTQWNHYRALMVKNYILFSRKRVCCIMQIAIPVFMAAFLFLLRSQIERESIKSKSYASMAVPMYNTFINTTSHAIKNCKTNQRRSRSHRNGHIALVGDNYFTQNLGDFFSKMNYSTKSYGTRNEFMSYLQGESYNEDVCIGISFDIDESKNFYSYALHFNTSSFDFKEDDVPDTNSPLTIPYQIERFQDTLQLWVRSGFLTIQNLIGTPPGR